MANGKGSSGNYLFELIAQPGGPEGRSDTMTGSWPIRKIELPRNGRPLGLLFFDNETTVRNRPLRPYPDTI